MTSSPSSAASPPGNSQIPRKRRKSQQSIPLDATRTPKTPLADTPQYIESPLTQTEVQTPAGHQESDEEIEDEDWGATQISQAIEGTSKEEESAQMAMLMNKFSPEQMSRYEAFRRGNLNKAAIKKVVSQMLAQNVSANIPIVVAGFAKVFVGEIVERALEVRDARGQKGALTPEHLREAYRLQKEETSTVPKNQVHSRLFR